MTIPLLVEQLVTDYKKTVLGFCLAYEAANPYATEWDRLQALEDAFTVKEATNTARGQDVRLSRRFVKKSMSANR